MSASTAEKQVTLHKIAPSPRRKLAVAIPRQRESTTTTGVSLAVNPKPTKRADHLHQRKEKMKSVSSMESRSVGVPSVSVGGPITTDRFDACY